MIDPKSQGLLLALASAVIAILWERFNPLSRQALGRQAKEVVENEKFHVQPEALQEFAVGAVSISSLGPTMISVWMAIMTVLIDQQVSSIWFFVANALFAIIVFALLRVISKRSHYRTATDFVREVEVLKRRKVTYAGFYSACVLGLNIVVIMICLGFLCPWLNSLMLVRSPVAAG